jgi:hypothetical protein
MKKVSKDDVAQSFSTATSMMGRISADLYDDLFDESGNSPIVDQEAISELILATRKKINLEFDLIRSAVEQYIDDNRDNND